MKIMSFSIFQQHVFNSGEHMKTFLLAAWNVADEFLFLGVALPHNPINEFESAGIFPTPRVPKPLALYPGHSPTVFNPSPDALTVDPPVQERGWEAANTQYSTRNGLVLVDYMHAACLA